MYGRGPMQGTNYEPDCCGCFPLECGVRTLFFLTFLGTIGIIINIIISSIQGQWFVLIQLLMLPAAIFTLFYVLQWLNTDNFYNRNKICQGFRCMFIVNVIVNLIILLLVIFAINELWDTEEVQNAVNQYYNNQTLNQYGQYLPQGQQPNNQYQYVPPPNSQQGNLGGRFLQIPQGNQVPISAEYQQQYQNLVNQG